MIKLRTYSPLETAQIGYQLGKLLRKGDIICLKGNLGTGKTAFTGGIAEAMGINDYITSPTFTIVNEYRARMPLYHFDVYRISDPDEMFEIGFEEYIDGNGVVVIEWADMITGVLPEECIWVEISKDMENGPETRVITIEFRGERYEGYEARFSLTLSPSPTSGA